MRRTFLRFLAVGAALGLALAGWWAKSPQAARPSIQPASFVRVSASGSSADASETVVAPTMPRVLWTDPVEHLFFHPLVRRPDLAFDNTRLGQGFRDYFVTVGEFRAIVQSMYDNDWVLVDMQTAVDGTLMVPVGKKPVVISVDDLNFYDYLREAGGAWRLVKVENRVRVEVHDPDTGVVSITDEEIVPILDDFVMSNPDFSVDGAKGVIALTGYEGVLGERVEDSEDHAAIDRARAIADQMKANGWRFASHSYGHIPIKERSVSQVRVDAAKWQAVVESVVGPTEIFIYPYGAAPSSNAAHVRMLRDEFGFRIFCDIGGIDMQRGDGWVRYPRRHVDGLGFSGQADTLAKFFDVNDVIDTESRKPN